MNRRLYILHKIFHLVKFNFHFYVTCPHENKNEIASEKVHTYYQECYAIQGALYI